MLAGRRLAAAARLTRRPVSTLPVKLILLTPGWPLSGAPASAPSPVTMFSTPAGSLTASAWHR